MSKKKRQLPSYQTKQRSGRERQFFIAGNSLIYDEKFLSLSSNSKLLYFYMLNESKGQQVFEFPHHIYIKLMSNGTFQKSRNELIEKGFIVIAENNGNLRKANRYRFLTNWKE